MRPGATMKNRRVGGVAVQRNWGRKGRNGLRREGLAMWGAGGAWGVPGLVSVPSRRQWATSKDPRQCHGHQRPDGTNPRPRPTSGHFLTPQLHALRL